MDINGLQRKIESIQYERPYDQQYDKPYDVGTGAGIAPVSYRSEYGVNGHKRNSSGITTEEEKNHVIKVLEHESKVYKF
jgi:hypothetical protein